MALVLACGYLPIIRVRRQIFLERRPICGSTSPCVLHISKTIACDRLVDPGPMASTMALWSARSSAFGHCPTSDPYRAAGRIMVLMVWSRCVFVIGRRHNLLIHPVAVRSLFASVMFVLVVSRHMCAPRSLKWFRTLMVIVLVCFAARRRTLADCPALPAPKGPVAWASLWLVAVLLLMCGWSLVAPGMPVSRDGREVFPDVHVKPDSNVSVADVPALPAPKGPVAWPSL